MKYIIITILLALGGCFVPQENNFIHSTLNYADVADREAVSDCMMIDRVYGQNKRNRQLAPTGEIIAMRIVRAKAHARGGSHVLLEPTVSTENATYIIGNVYDCSQKAKSELNEELALDNPEELSILED